MHLSYVCYLAKFMNLFKKRNFFSIYTIMKGVNMKGFSKRANKRL